MLNHDFHHLIDALNGPSPPQIEDAQAKIRDLWRRTEAISEIEARTNQECGCPHCGDGRRQEWGHTRAGVQRYRCTGCQKIELAPFRPDTQA